MEGLGQDSPKERYILQCVKAIDARLRPTQVAAEWFDIFQGSQNKGKNCLSLLVRSKNRRGEIITVWHTGRSCERCSMLHIHGGR